MTPDDLRRRTAQSRERLAAVRALRELEAAASARSDRVTARMLRAQGHPSPSPPIPTHPPDWLGGPDQGA